MHCQLFAGEPPVNCLGFAQILDNEWMNDEDQTITSRENTGKRAGEMRRNKHEDEKKKSLEN